MRILPFKFAEGIKPRIETRLIVGLGNPGNEYKETRHNIGFLVLEKIAEGKRALFKKRMACGELAEHVQGASRLVFLKPATFMNRSGEAVKKALSRYQIRDMQNILVIVDDADLPFGKLRLRGKGTSGGHRGLESVIQAVGTTSFPRLRIGIGRAGERDELKSYVLEPFSGEEISQLVTVIGVAVDAVHAWLENGCEEAMNRVNRAHAGGGLSGH